eukprot:102820-Chlamydomonas_euryale.AAC.1
MGSQGAPRAAAALGDARDSHDDGETSFLNSFNGSHSSPQNSASFRSDIHDKSYGYDSVEGTGDNRSVSRETVSTGPSESIASDPGGDFRQILPVVPGSNRAGTVAASVTNVTIPGLAA